MSATDPVLEPLPWETRNLGVEAFGVSAGFLEKPDDTALRGALGDLRSVHRRHFVQARFEPDTRTSRILQANGFYFVETTLSPHVVLSRCEPLRRFALNPSGVVPGRYSFSDLELALLGPSDSDFTAVRQIARESFIDDRFHVDHNCDAETASRRYVYWVDELVQDHAVRFHALRFKRQPVAFMASRGGSLLLAGFARKYANAGLGEFFWLSVLERLRRDGIDSVHTLISTANVAVVNLYCRLGFKFRAPQATFHCWGGA